MNYSDFSSRFELDFGKEKKLGVGGHGQVYKAWDTIENEDVAIKVSKVENLKSELTLKNEVELAKELDRHKNVIRYQDCFRLRTNEGWHDYAIMKYYPDGNLNTYLQNNPNLSEAIRIQVSLGIMDGIQHIHKAGIIHRDLKPSNILIFIRKEQIIPLISDFGLAVRSKANDPLESNVLGGTLKYCSLEQLKGSELTKGSDLWSLGILLYKIFTSGMPYDKSINDIETSEAMVEYLSKNKLKLKLEKIPSGFQRVIKECLVLKNGNRCQDIDQLMTYVDNHRSKKKQAGKVNNIPPLVSEEDEITLEIKKSTVGGDKKIGNKEGHKERFFSKRNISIMAGLSFLVLTVLIWSLSGGEEKTYTGDKKNEIVDEDGDGIDDFHSVNIDGINSKEAQVLRGIMDQTINSDQSQGVRFANLNSNKNAIDDIAGDDITVIVDGVVFQEGIYGVLFSFLNNTEETLKISSCVVPTGSKITHLEFESIPKQ